MLQVLANRNRKGMPAQQEPLRCLAASASRERPCAGRKPRGLADSMFQTKLEKMSQSLAGVWMRGARRQYSRLPASGKSGSRKYRQE